MKTVHRFTVLIEREGDGFVALCPEVDVASQGDSVEQAASNLREALELFLESADPSEVQRRLRPEVFVTHHDVVRVGTLLSIIRTSGVPRAAFEAEGSGSGQLRARSDWQPATGH